MPTPSFSTSTLRGRRQLHLSKTECTLFLKDIQYLPIEEADSSGGEVKHHDHDHDHQKTDFHSSRTEEKWSCEFSPAQAKNLGVDTVEIEGIDEKFLQSHGAKSGRSTLFISEGTIEGTEKIIVPSTASVEVHELSKDEINDRRGQRQRRQQQHRNLATPSGRLRTLVVRVIAKDGTEPTASIQKMRADVFEDKLCLKSQYDACSHGQLKIEPYQGKTQTGRSISGGVVDVKINSNPVNGNKQTFETNAKAKAAELYGDLTQFDLILFCIPPGTGDWLAYAYVNRLDSYYNDNWCSSISTQVHEVGHNLGLAHSGEGFITYGDQSGMMGYSYDVDDAPKMCFNAAKSYELGWYTKQSKSVDPLTQILAKNWANSKSFVMNGVDDYQFGRNGSTNNLISLRLKQQNSADDYYIGFNRKAGMNSGTVEDANKVTIIRKTGGPNEYGQSWKVSKLSTNDNTSYTIKNFDNSSFNVNVKLVSIAGRDAKIKINVTNSVSCSKVKNRNLTYKNKKSKTCNWVSKKKRRRCSKTWRNENLSEWCPKTCGSC
ncbi:hypothetical protein FRACYDRAFT_247795 [Fragilariopsis cylindrus CCMP1102]|uniref:ShKT domain-containing protein n=1 Tax=Fragilariopsis cylindrus CCMP1102 TaxID=635003 RepID=A0A1E7EWB1_9STRA|nr:hypothetical protein FRACYDRAFT_247795 [Fragilariopsis cylindrus CCMP1102]|eukprot:OEU10182.1 hypothetical protein FRACYDRAFT_247795 [Fragilariopsis cylindrus CCMP1102]